MLVRGLPKEPKNYIYTYDGLCCGESACFGRFSHGGIFARSVQTSRRTKNNFLSAAGSSLKTVLQWKQKKSLSLLTSILGVSIYIYIYTCTRCAEN